jgi:hypothetical protein
VRKAFEADQKLKEEQKNALKKQTEEEREKTKNAMMTIQ